MLFPCLLTQHTSEAMHVQGNDGQSNTSGKSLSTFRPNTVEATVFKIVDGRLHSGVLTAHSSKRFTLFAFPISLAEAALPRQGVVNKQFIKAGAVRRAVEAAIKTHSAESRKQILHDFDQRYGEIEVTAATVVEKKTRIIMSLPASCPHQSLIRLLFEGPAPPHSA